MRRVLLVLLAVCLTAALAPGAADAARPPGTRISNEVDRTVWAHPVLKGPVLARPRSGGRRVSRLRLRTEDGFREVYLVLRRYRDPRGRTWFQLRLPARPNGQRG